MNGSHWNRVHHHHWHRHSYGWHGHRFNPLPGLLMLGLLLTFLGVFKFFLIPLLFFFIFPMFMWKGKRAMSGWGCNDATDYEFDSEYGKSKNGETFSKRKNGDDDPFYPEII